MPTSTELAKTYAPRDVEPQILARWNDARAFHAEPDAPGEPYAIVIPPPNVTAALHMGHALNNTLQDILIRHHRMLGDNTLWMPGTDHAGIATQTVVEKRVLKEEGKKRTDFERDEFIAKIQAWKDEYEQTILGQLKAMGCSCDWERTRFTMDPICARAVREAFFRMFKDGLIYRGKRLVNWDPVTQTALADDEVEMQEVDGNFYYLKYPLEDGSGTITVATTRPETMLGDTAVAMNPRDPRAAEFRGRGRKVRLPIVNRVVPIIEDEYVTLPDAESADVKARYSSGFLKVTPAHDPNDYELGRKHDLAMINVMAPDASISLDHGWAAVEPEQRENVELKLIVGLPREAARRTVVKFFKDHGLLQEIKPYRHSVGHSYRSHVAIEPYLSDQWYIAVKKQIPSQADEGMIEGTDVPRNSLAGMALRALAPDQRGTPQATEPGTVSPDTPDTPDAPDAPDAPHAPEETKPRPDSQSPALSESSWEGQLRFTPERYARTFETWHQNIRDWCISRQLWWGHRIPVWSRVGLPSEFYSPGQPTEFLPTVFRWENEGRLAFQGSGRLIQPTDDPRREAGQFICVKSDTDLEVIGYLQSHGFTQDPDVLDTWFSSGLWPLSTLGWPEETPELRTWNPTSVLCTAREIITLWVSRMVMFNLYFRECLPFTDVFIHAMIQDGEGRKMSKSLGNGVDPLDIIDSHGSDAMRFTLAIMTTNTQDVRMPVLRDPATGRNTSDKFDVGRNFANKLWNAVRFALASLSDTPLPPSGSEGNGRPSEGEGGEGTGEGEGENDSTNPAGANQAQKTPEIPSPQPSPTRGSGSQNSPGRGGLSLPDKWVLSRLAATVRDVDAALSRFEFSVYAQTLYDFFWRDLCDWYIEIVKPTVRENPAQRRVLALCIDASLRLLHPMMPFVTEKLWERLNDVAPHREVSGVKLTPGALLIHAAWPQVSNGLIDEGAEQRFALVQQVVGAIREARTTYKVPPRQKLKASAQAPAALAQELLEQREVIQTLANIAGGEIGPRVEKPADAAVVLVRDVQVYLHGLIDAGAERTRLSKRLEELTRSVGGLSGRLQNASYLEKAPPHLVQQTRDQLAAAEREAESLRQQMAGLDTPSD